MKSEAQVTEIVLIVMHDMRTMVHVYVTLYFFQKIYVFLPRMSTLRAYSMQKNENFEEKTSKYFISHH